MARSDKRKIDKAHRLPCDFVVGHIRFGKGVALETVRTAAERWLKAAQVASAPVDGEKLKALVEQLQNSHS